MKKTLLALTAACFITATAIAQNPGDLDLTFGTSGYTLTDHVANVGERYLDLITLADDKIIKVGSSETLNNRDVLVAKFLSDGTPDISFGVNGVLTVDMSLGQDEQARGIVELPDGKLLITGYVDVAVGYDAFIMRINANGTVDNSFGTSSGHTKFNMGDNVTAFGRSVSLIGNEIFVAGSVADGGQWDGMLVNFTMGGGIDISFASSGFASFDISGTSDYVNSFAINSSNEFFIGGRTITALGQVGFITKLTSFGTPSTFAGSGTYIFDVGQEATSVSDLLIDANNKIVSTGYDGIAPNIDGFILRLNPDGTKDAAFGTNGLIVSNPGATVELYLNSILETSDGGYISSGSQVGTNNEVYVLYLNPDGSYNTSFGGNGDVIVPFTITLNSINTKSSALQSDGSLIIGGYITSQDFVGENMYMIRLYPNNLSVSEIDMKNISAYPNPIIGAFSVDAENVTSIKMVSLQGEVVKIWGSESIYTLPNNVISGVYLLQVTTEDSYGVTRVLVK